MNRNLSMPIITRALARKPVNGSLLLLSLDTWNVPLLPGWNEIHRDGNRLSDKTSYLQVIHQSKERSGQMMMVTLYARGSRAEAGDTLAEALEHNHLAELPQGPDDLGEVSFLHPDSAAPAVLFSRANICAAVSSFGGENTEVLAMAKSLDDAISARPEQAETGALSLTAQRETPSSHVLSVNTAALPRNQFYKFWCGSGELSLVQGTVTLTFDENEEAAAKVYVYQIASHPAATPIVASVDILPKAGSNGG